MKCKIQALCLAALLLGCATGSKPEPDAQADAAPVAKDGKITLSLAPTSIEEAVRRIGEESGGGVVLMNGLGQHIAPAFEFKGKSCAAAADEIAKIMKLKTHDFDGYSFIYTDGYEGLLEMNLATLLDPQFAEKRIALSVGSNTHLYNALNLLGHSLGTTIIADNLIADARCGEIALQEVSIATALEAILRSARIPQDQLNMVSTPDFLFFGAKSLGARTESVENLGADYLGKQVSLYLPRPVPGKETMPFYNEITTLGEVQATLAEQLGVTVELGEGLDKLPINPCAMNGLTVQTVVNLLIWQWPVTNIKCQAEAGALKFVEVK